MARDMLKPCKKDLMDQQYSAIQAHILDPENSPLPDVLKEQLNRVIQVARLLDDYPNEGNVFRLMKAKYRVSDASIRRDIQLARMLYKTHHTFDWDFWFAWQVKDQIELIDRCKTRNDLKAWNNAKKVLHEIIGDKPEAVEDPRRMERNVFNIQVNYNGQTLTMDLDRIRTLSPNLRKEVLQQLYEPVDDSQVDEIMDS